jgi:hypothetical protein
MPGRLTFSTTPDGANAYTERMRITNSGDLLVGKTSANTATEGVEFRSFGLGAFTRSGNQPIIANRTSNNGIILELQKDGTQVGVIGTLSSNLYVGSLDTGLYFNNSTDSIYAINTTTNAGRDNAIDLGVSGTRFKDIYLGGGLYIGGTGDANKLDDYEEGTWTPNVVPASGTVTLSGAHGSYTKIGRAVYLTAFGVVSSVSSPSGQLNLQSIPFTPQNENQNASAHAMSYYNWNTGTYFLNGETATAGNQIVIYNNNNGTRGDAASLINDGS